MTTSPFYGLRVVTSERLTEIVRVDHDRDRFIEYGPEDESWRRYFGFVTTEVVPSSAVMRLGDTLYMHPVTYAAVKLALTPGGAA